MNAPVLLALADFAPLVGQILTVSLPVKRDDSPPVPLTLVEARALRAHDYPGRVRDPFSLMFDGPETPFLGQDSYAFLHPVHGVQSLFLVAIGRSAAGGFRYQVIFN